MKVIFIPILIYLVLTNYVRCNVSNDGTSNVNSSQANLSFFQKLRHPWDNFIQPEGSKLLATINVFGFGNTDSNKSSLKIPLVITEDKTFKQKLLHPWDTYIQPAVTNFLSLIKRVINKEEPNSMVTETTLCPLADTPVINSTLNNESLLPPISTAAPSAILIVKNNLKPVEN